ncbi:hypothetical protein NQD34_001327 [Periophthalmus magnuspinnatus]|nr:hypothetical protein NQD34_001327 [Periophthalmus magnuspinnatus]
MIRGFQSGKKTRGTGYRTPRLSSFSSSSRTSPPLVCLLLWCLSSGVSPPPLASRLQKLRLPPPLCLSSSRVSPSLVSSSRVSPPPLVSLLLLSRLSSSRLLLL